MTAHPQLKSADELAKNNGVRFLNESREYRQARDALLAEEIKLRRHIERVALQRCAGVNRVDVCQNPDNTTFFLIFQ